VSKGMYYLVLLPFHLHLILIPYDICLGRHGPARHPHMTCVMYNLTIQHPHMTCVM